MAAKETKILIAGFGGQGVVVAGKTLAQACIYEGKNVTAMVSYGAEMRGGTANCTLVVADGEITSPIVEKPDVAVIMNQPSLDKFGKEVVRGGTIILNTSLAEDGAMRGDIGVAGLKASDEATKLGSVRAANMVCLGALAGKTGLLKMESLGRAVEEVFGEKGPKVVGLNKKALEAGAALVGQDGGSDAGSVRR
jgi:2-oxoglutarate ferredoxin oxidoreductase subunit gamma